MAPRIIFNADRLAFEPLGLPKLDGPEDAVAKAASIRLNKLQKQLDAQLVSSFARSNEQQRQEGLAKLSDAFSSLFSVTSAEFWIQTAEIDIRDLAKRRTD